MVSGTRRNTEKLNFMIDNEQTMTGLTILVLALSTALLVSYPLTTFVGWLLKKIDQFVRWQRANHAIFEKFSKEKPKFICPQCMKAVEAYIPGLKTPDLDHIVSDCCWVVLIADWTPSVASWTNERVWGGPFYWLRYSKTERKAIEIKHKANLTYPNLDPQP
jgi:hypothetical protein